MADPSKVTSIAGGATGAPLGGMTGMLQGGLSSILNMGTGILDKILPPAKREDLKAKLTKFATEKPYLASFLLSQIAISGFPMFLFITMTITVAVFALIAGLLVGLLGAILFILAAVGFALVILLPVLFVTTFAAVGIWLWGMGAYYIVKWFNKKDVPGVNVPMADGIKDATGLNDLTGGLGLTGQDGAGAGAGAEKPQANGTTEKSKSKEADADSKTQGSTPLNQVANGPKQLTSQVEKLPSQDIQAVSDVTGKTGLTNGNGSTTSSRSGSSGEHAHRRPPKLGSSAPLHKTTSGVSNGLSGVTNGIGVGV